MSSPLSSALEKLDGSLHTIYSEIDCLGTSLEMNDDRLVRSLANARQHAAALRDLVRAERPGARWTNRKALDELIHELEVEIAAKARRNQQRRDKLLALANELDAGKVRHRVVTRAAALNALRTKAVGELRAEASPSEKDAKNLPGPTARDWLLWACNLQEEKDSAILEELHRNFPAVEAFVGQMEESYWIPSPSVQKPSAPSHPQPSVGRAEESAAQLAQVSLPGDSEEWDDQPPENVGTEFYTATHTANYVYSLALRNSRPGSGNSSTPQPLKNAQTPTPAQSTAVVTESLLGAIAAAPHDKLCHNCGATFPDEFELCPFDGSSLQPLAVVPPPPSNTSKVPQKSEVHAAAPAAGQSQVQSLQSGAIGPRPTAELGKVAERQQGGDRKASGDAEIERLKAILVEHKSAGEFQLLGNASVPKKLVLGFASGGAMVLAILLAVVYLSSGATVSKLKSAVVAARAQVTASREPVKDSDILVEVERRLAALTGSSIHASVEDGVVTLVGRTPSQWEALHAESLAAQTDGVKLVRNQVQVGGADSRNAKRSRPKSRT